jgi:hypothetical protein
MSKSGTVRLEINGKTMAQRRYYNRAQRLKIVSEWMGVFERQVHTQYVYVIVCPDVKSS